MALFLGIDGGGTGCRAALADADGTPDEATPGEARPGRSSSSEGADPVGAETRRGGPGGCEPSDEDCRRPG